MMKPLATLLVSTSLLTPVVPYVAQAQSTADDTIIVTARKRSEDLHHIPASVHIESGTALENRRAQDGQSVLRDISGATAGTFGDRSNGFIVMRGVAPILSPLSPDDSSVLTFVDGAPLPIGGSFSSVYLDVNRIEVMKGPQNTLFGRNTSGGAINLIPAEPTQNFEAGVRAEIGSDGYGRVETLVNGAIIPDVLSGRLALRRTKIDGHIRNSAGEDLGREDVLTGRASLLFTPSSRTSWLVSYMSDDADTSPTTYIALRPGGTRIAAQNHTIDDTRIELFSSRLEHTLGGMTLTLQNSYATLKGHNIYNYPDANIASDFSELEPEAFLDPDSNFIAWDKDESRLTHELRLTSAPDSAIGWLVGATVYEDKAERERTSEMWYFGPSSTGLMTYDLTTKGKAVFAEATIPLSAKLRLSLGGRYTSEDKRFSSEFTSDGVAGAVTYFAEDNKRSYDFSTGRAGLSYDWTPQFTAYASLSHGYKSGGFALDNSLMWAGVARNPYDSSSVISYEIGGRGVWLDNRLRLNGALYSNDMRKEQFQTWDYNNFTGQTLNLDARSSGFELEGQYRVSDGLSVSAAVVHTKTEVRNVSAQLAAAQDGLRDGNWLPTVPRWSGRVAADYHTRASAWGIQGGLSDAEIGLRLSYNYVGKRFTDVSNFGKLPQMDLVAARLSLNWGDGEAYLFGDNLLGERYMTIKERFGTNSEGQPVFGVSYSRGATWGAGVSLRF
ncbi:MAG: TonB-dependent receptor [Asticcacaulis sp.]